MIDDSSQSWNVTPCPIYSFVSLYLQNKTFFFIYFVQNMFPYVPLTYGGGLIGPPLFQRPRSLEMLSCQKFEKISITLLGSLLCESILLLLQ
jgi:hypothetical protein